VTGIVDRRAGRPARGALEIPCGLAPATSWRIPILMYHEITAEPLAADHLAVSPQEFARQLGYLYDSGYTTLTVAGLVRAMTREYGRLPARPVVLTFDDGFADFHDAALPVLLRYGFSGTVFVTTGWIADSGAARTACVPPGMLSWSQIDAVAAAGIEIGAHSEHHPELDQLCAEKLRQELRGSKYLLEDRLGVPVTGLAYPFGYSNQRVRETAVAAGYRYACAVDNRLADESADQFALPRLTIGRNTRMPRFSQIVGAGRLPPEFLAYRMLTRGWSAVRHTRAAVHQIIQ